MDENVKIIFDQYKSQNPEITEEVFIRSYQDFGDEYLNYIQDDLKKKSIRLVHK